MVLTLGLQCRKQTSSIGTDLLEMVSIVSLPDSPVELKEVGHTVSFKECRSNSIIIRISMRSHSLRNSGLSALDRASRWFGALEMLVELQDEGLADDA